MCGQHDLHRKVQQRQECLSRPLAILICLVPAVALAGALTLKCVAAAALTATAPLVPVMELVTVSVAVRVWLPAVLRVAVKVPAPLVRVALTGSTACPWLQLKRTVPP